MLGSIIGDLAGSIYEFEQFKKVSKINVKNIIEENAFFSDDTILTMAILDAILNNTTYESKLKAYGLKYSNLKPTEPYFEKMFSPGFEKWLNSNIIGESKGNGAMMRISPVGFMFNTEQEVKDNAIKATIPSHNTLEAIECATQVALVIFYARMGLTKEQIVRKLNIKLNYVPFKTFNYTCAETIDNCMYALFTSNSFEESIKKVISYGGDTDTNACIVGGMAEALFGISEELKQKAIRFLPPEFVELLNEYYKNKIKGRLYEKLNDK